MSYLSDAINCLERSDSDMVVIAKKEDFLWMAIANTLVSIAQSLESITETLSVLREVAEHENIKD
jgi:heme exporter protein D